MSGGDPLANLREHADVIVGDLRLIGRLAPAGARVLDVGAGRGSFVTAARARGLRVVALEMGGTAAPLWAREGVPGIIADGGRAPFVGGAFDVVRMKEVIEHVEAPLRLIREAGRLVRPGGFVIIHTPTPYSQFYPVGNFWDDYTHVRPFSRTGLRRLIEDAGLELIAIDAYVSGRNALERGMAVVLARVFPHIYRAVARRVES